MNDPTWRIIEGDCLDVLRTLPSGSMHAVVTDPPAGISFMGKAWDGHKGGRAQWVAWLTGVMMECRRVLKPGGHALVWALPRTSHWTATAIEDAGFEIRDVIMHIFGSGFPKSLDVSKAIDATVLYGSSHTSKLKKANEEERKEVGERYEPDRNNGFKQDYTELKRIPITEAATKEARQWDGWGTALKPSAEHWILARTPLVGTVAANVQAHGTGALNIDGCRILSDESTVRVSNAGTNGDGWGMGKNAHLNGSESGRWPANVTLDEYAAAMLDEQSGTSTSVRPDATISHREDTQGYGGNSKPFETQRYMDSGGASRFFYVAKPSPSERNAGLDADPRTTNDGRKIPIDNPYLRGETTRQNHHPTVKPIALMQYLCRLITPPGGTVLDPFAGSGTTGMACMLEGFDFLGIEQDTEYAEIARHRIAWQAAQPKQVVLPLDTEARPDPPTRDEATQAAFVWSTDDE